MTSNGPSDGSETTRLLTSPERLGENLTRQIYGGKIYLFTLTSLADEVVDAWAKALDDLYGLVELSGDPDKRKVFVLNDFSKLDMNTTAYMRTRMSELHAKHSDLRGWAAKVISPTLYGHLPELQREWLEGKIQWRYFSAKDEALQWLLIMNGKYGT